MSCPCVARLDIPDGGKHVTKYLRISQMQSHDPNEVHKYLSHVLDDSISDDCLRHRDNAVDCYFLDSSGQKIGVEFTTKLDTSHINTKTIDGQQCDASRCRAVIVLPAKNASDIRMKTGILTCRSHRDCAKLPQLLLKYEIVIVFI